MTLSGIHSNATDGNTGDHYKSADAFARSVDYGEDCVSEWDFYVLDRIPTWIQIENPNFVEFVSVFYEWLSCEMDVQLDFLNDIDTTKDDFIKLIKNTYAAGFPDRIVLQEGGYFDDSQREARVVVDFINPEEGQLDVRNFIHFVKDFYQMKSMEEVYTFFFRTFFDAPVEISLPKQRVIRLSDSPYRGASAGNDGALCDVSGLTGDDGGVTGSCWGFVGSGSIGQEGDPGNGNVDGFTGCYNPGSTYAIENPALYPPCEFQYCAPGSPCGMYYWDELGTLSGWSKIQDSKIWQDYSYLINSPIPFNTYWQYISKLIHPAGLYAVGNYTIYDDFPQPGTTGEIFPVETPIIGNYTPYRFAEVVNLKNNENEVDLYPCGYNPFLGGTGTSTHIQTSNGLWYKDVSGTTAHQPRLAGDSSAFAPLGLTSDDGSITGGTAASRLGVSFFRIYHHPNSWSSQVVPGMSFGGVQLGEFYFLSGIDNSSSPNDPSGSSAGCGF